MCMGYDVMWCDVMCGYEYRCEFMSINNNIDMNWLHITPTSAVSWRIKMNFKLHLNFLHINEVNQVKNEKKWEFKMLNEFQWKPKVNRSEKRHLIY